MDDPDEMEKDVKKKTEREVSLMQKMTEKLKF